MGITQWAVPTQYLVRSGLWWSFFERWLVVDLSGFIYRLLETSPRSNDIQHHGVKCIQQVTTFFPYTLSMSEGIPFFLLLHSNHVKNNQIYVYYNPEYSHGISNHGIMVAGIHARLPCLWIHVIAPPLLKTWLNEAKSHKLHDFFYISSCFCVWYFTSTITIYQKRSHNSSSNDIVRKSERSCVHIYLRRYFQIGGVFHVWPI
jgi:hypothetical protein